MSTIGSIAKNAAKAIVPNAIKNTRLFQTLRRLLESHDSIYDEAYYDRDVEGPAAQAAPHIASSIVTRFKPKSLIDVGCGTGVMLTAFRRHGLDVRGLEYSTAGLRRCKERQLNVQRFDLERDTLRTARTYDLALSLEVAEHLPEQAADRFVRLLCESASIVVVSAAKPGQGGVDHVNLQPQSYWIRKFAECGHSYNSEITDQLVADWRTANIISYYYENLMVFQKTTAAFN